jgi:tellurite methyltransferase
MSSVPASLRQMDIMLLDQVCRDRIPAAARILDAGCGGGRNLEWFLEQGHVLTACDPDAGAIESCRQRFGTRVELHQAALPELPVPSHAFDLVLCNAVLHFAPDEAAFRAWFAELVRTLAPGGRLFIRCATTIAWPGPLPCGDDGRVTGACHFRYLVGREQLLALLEQHGLRLADPLKTTVVDGQRVMSTVVAEVR